MKKATPKTVSLATNKKELNKILNGLTINELLNDMILELSIIQKYNKVIAKLDRQHELTQESYFEELANMEEEKMNIAYYLYERVKKRVETHIDAMSDKDFIKWIEELDKRSKEINSRGNKTKTAQIAQQHLSIIYKYIGMKYKEAA